MRSVVRAAVAAVLGLTTVVPVMAQRIASSSDLAGNVDAGGSNEAANADAESGPGKIDTLIVLGTALHDTTALTSTAPVDVITPEQLQQTGSVTINQALLEIASVLQFPAGPECGEGAGGAFGLAARRGACVHAGAGEWQAAQSLGATRGHRSLAVGAGRRHQHHSPSTRSITSKCSATGRRRNTVPTPLRASSTSCSRKPPRAAILRRDTVATRMAADRPSSTWAPRASVLARPAS